MKLISIKGLKDKAWKLMSLWVRRKDANWQGFNYCFTCDKRFHYKALHAGHYIHGRLDFEPNNLKPQCVGCNKFKHGNLGIYGERLIRLIGAEAVNEMRLYSFKKGNDYSRDELNKIILDLQNKLLNI